MDGSGNLYGTTRIGGAGAGFGTVFELPKAPFLVTGFASPTTAGIAQTFTVTAQDAYGTAVNTAYTGTISFTTSDGQAVLPQAYTFTSADAGVHAFTATLKTAGSQSLTVTD